MALIFQVDSEGHARPENAATPAEESLKITLLELPCRTLQAQNPERLQNRFFTA
jgi:hypothetical protein